MPYETYTAIRTSSQANGMTRLPPKRKPVTESGQLPGVKRASSPLANNAFQRSFVIFARTTTYPLLENCPSRSFVSRRPIVQLYHSLFGSYVGNTKLSPLVSPLLSLSLSDAARFVLRRGRGEELRGTASSLFSFGKVFLFLICKLSRPLSVIQSSH